TRSILASAEERGLSLSRVGEEVVVVLDGVPAEPVIRSPEVTAAVPEVSALPGVRHWANLRFRAAAEGGVRPLLDGRDIGAGVVPDAPLKVFLTASPLVRARRRLEQLAIEPSPQALAETTARLTARDLDDSTRTVAPLRRAPDAVELDTT